MLYCRAQSSADRSKLASWTGTSGRWHGRSRDTPRGRLDRAEVADHGLGWIVSRLLSQSTRRFELVVAWLTILCHVKVICLGRESHPQMVQEPRMAAFTESHGYCTVCIPSTYDRQEPGLVMPALLCYHVVAESVDRAGVARPKDAIQVCRSRCLFGRRAAPGKQCLGGCIQSMYRLGREYGEPSPRTGGLRGNCGGLWLQR